VTPGSWWGRGWSPWLGGSLPCTTRASAPPALSKVLRRGPAYLLPISRPLLTPSRAAPEGFVHRTGRRAALDGLFAHPSLTAHPLAKAQRKWGSSFPLPRPVLGLQPPVRCPPASPGLSLKSSSSGSSHPWEAAWSQEGSCPSTLCAPAPTHPAASLGAGESPALRGLGGKRGGGGSQRDGEEERQSRRAHKRVPGEQWGEEEMATNVFGK